MYSRNGCGCIQPGIQFEEYQFKDKLITKGCKLDLGIPRPNLICELKEKVICDYDQILQDLECGKHPELEFILQEISLIDTYYDY